MSTAMLASDLNNPEFVGAVNPDKLLHVEFYMFEPLDQVKSREAGRRIYQTKHVPGKVRVDPKTGLEVQEMRDTGEKLRIPYVRIMKPGDNTSILEVPVREDHKARWPQEWLYFASHEGLVDDGSQVPGWKIEEWPYINSDTESVRNLKYLRFHTVEQIAGASDAQIQKLGIGGMGLREAAKRALQDKMKTGLSAELAAKDKEIADLKSQMAQFADFMHAQQNQKPVEPPPAQPETAAPKKRGRPKKVTGGEQHPT